MKKLLLVSLFLLLSLTAFAKKYVVDSKDGYANLREKSNSKSKIIKKLENNVEMVLWRTEGDWYYVGVEIDGSYFDTDGYIHKSQLKLHPETYVISSEDQYADVRNEPTTDSDLIIKLKNDVIVTNFKEYQKGDWCYIEFERGDGTPFDYGYVHKSQLEKYSE